MKNACNHMPSRTKQTQPFRPKRVSPIHLLIGKTILRGMETRNSSLRTLNMPLPPQSSEIQPFPLPILPRPDVPVGGRLAHFVEQWEELTDTLRFETVSGYHSG